MALVKTPKISLVEIPGISPKEYADQIDQVHLSYRNGQTNIDTATNKIHKLFLDFLSNISVEGWFSIPENQRVKTFSILNDNMARLSSEEQVMAREVNDRLDTMEAVYLLEQQVKTLKKACSSYI